ncbi:phenazine biosynthesis-like domain-containing protein isoform X2 [Colius striatus]|uniref:phenazine biosynthesis-like domain-containing protein isoform X2 n=1 Tax=Colius striatus TaxID=57412 RepID=UPI002B1E8AA8|nr:phenazine biosynthesis-like domain-containing protein isoform X2 [Colius striatus]
MQIPVFMVDTFVNRPFSGNPAAVCLLENDLDENLHQKIATEMNLSETAFIRKLHPGDDFTKSSRFGLRWFTPAVEVPLCGHATLASAAVLFHIRMGVYFFLQVLQEVEELIKAAVGDMVVQDVRFSPDTMNLLVRLSDTYKRSVLEELQVNAQGFLSAEKTGKVKGVILTLKGDSSGKHDFYSRYFSPWCGVLEDPVTGSTHAVLGSYWSEQLGKKEMLAFQCSRRGGELKISLRSDGRIDIAGQFAVVVKGNLTL